MNEEAKKFEQLIKNAQKIFITSHISPDPDALSSVLLLGTTLMLNFPGKKVDMALEEEPVNLDFLTGYNYLEFSPVIEALSQHKPDLFIMLDGNNYERCSRHAGVDVREYLRTNNIKTVIIDHHEPAGSDPADVYINNTSPATVQDVYDLCFKELELKQPKDYVQTAMVGLYADSGGFAYVKDGSEQKLFDFVKELVANGAKIEKVKNLLSRYSEDDITVLSELLKNVAHDKEYTYSFLPDEFINSWFSSGKSNAQLQPGTGTFLDQYVRNINGRQWGFIVYKNLLQGKNMYSVSLRSAGGVRDVSAIAALLGGGGHKPAAGAKFDASSLETALNKVKAAIENT